ncbi:FAD:protein FMN transferase [Frondihabitans sp. Leaf304]|uniref:FAD:protein FMN transferase n=1 Tax=Frondihabitans sp. Leaf304 TaxID=1736329 RepID=UPI000AB8AE85|nr:FAD:protein FMN transferase [Frondihabitans sp. Leaf304]
MSVHVFDTMGTVVSLRTPAGPLDDAALESIEDVFRSFDRRFSLYDERSPLSRIARGDLALTAADAVVRETYALALDWRTRTDGAFTPHRPDGVVDLSGVVKALAMHDAGTELDRHSPDWLLTVGGDVLGRGSTDGSAWRVGVVDPDARDRLLGTATLSGTRRALATSGVAERGQHIWRRGPETFVQVTVAADDVVTADVIATAITAGDLEDLDRLTASADVDVVAVLADGTLRATPGARAWVGR